MLHFLLQNGLFYLFKLRVDGTGEVAGNEQVDEDEAVEKRVASIDQRVDPVDTNVSTTDKRVDLDTRVVR